MNMKLYDTVKEILEKYPVTRSNDKKLIWTVYGTLGYIEDKKMKREDFFEAPNCESITRARRKVQENHPDLEANEYVKKARNFIESKKGNHVYHDEIKPKKTDKRREIDEIISL